MIDEITTVPTGPEPLLYDGDSAAFSVIEVRPSRGDGYDRPSKPVMPLLSRGHHLHDEFGAPHTVLSATVSQHSSPFGEYYYWYEYTVVNGRRVLN